ncbi:unnamed protein product, partial [Thlaspi arvense]
PRRFIRCLDCVFNKYTAKQTVNADSEKPTGKMAFRGGRRGKGRGKRGYGFDKPEPFVIFPETTLPDPKPISNDSKLLSSYFGFQKFWRNSPYHLGDGVSKQESESLDIERFSDALKPKKKPNKSGSSFYDFLLLRPDNFPKELLGGTRRGPVKRAKWTQEIANNVTRELKLVFNLADLKDPEENEEEEEEEEDKEENEEGEDKKENEEGEDKEENEDGEEVEESEGEELDNGDYDQNQDFDDDDDDDYNQAADDEEVY